MVGGFKDAREPTEEEVTFVQGLQTQIQERSNQQYESFKPVQVKTQVVAGTNYVFRI